VRFLLQWQHVAPGSQLHGRDGIITIIRQLQGLELPATGWEGTVLPARIANFDPMDLEQLCLAGAVTWGRLSRRDREEPGDESTTRRARVQRPGRQAPLALLLREDLHWLIARTNEETDLPSNISSAAESVVGHLKRHGASFLADIARATGQMPATVEDALWELVARGVVTGDGLAGLRVLLAPEHKRIQQRRHLRALPGGKAGARLVPAGRWALWAPWTEQDDESMGPSERTEHFAWQLLRRYGVVFRELLVREGQAPTWRELLAIYRRLEARGEVRGGRYVAGFVGEQFALPEAVEALRAVRRSKATDETILVQSADPLNLVGVLTPGGRVSPYSNQAIAYRDGVPVEVGPLGAVRARLRHLDESSEAR
jgi:ATP-dependent Lhr-like helicase